MDEAKRVELVPAVRHVCSCEAAEVVAGALPLGSKGRHSDFPQIPLMLIDPESTALSKCWPAGSGIGLVQQSNEGPRPRDKMSGTCRKGVPIACLTGEVKLNIYDVSHESSN